MMTTGKSINRYQVGLTMTRRQMLGAAAVMAAPPLHATAGLHPPEPDWKHQLDNLRGNPAAQMIAARYLHDHPEHNSRQAIELVLKESLARNENSFEVLIQSDFAHHRTLYIEGWPIAVTEARLCALLHL